MTNSYLLNLQIDFKSKEQGFKESRLPKFTSEESADILGSADFLGINFYTSRMVVPKTGNIKMVSYHEDKDIFAEPDPSWYK